MYDKIKTKPGGHTSMEKIREELQKTDIAGILSDMIKIPSFSLWRNRKKRSQDISRDFFDKEEIPCQI